MKPLLTILLAVAFGAAAYADIQSPPMVDMGPTRKLGRGLSNMLFGITELPTTIAKVNDCEGNNALGYGLVRGLGRSLFRFGVGWYEIVTFPAPCYKNSYRQPYPSNVPWTLGGYQEFPPELGFESRYEYTEP
jgi:putative exosortase-associated protein (TIGR04073 family)